MTPSSLDVDGSGTLYSAEFGEGIFLSTDGETWTGLQNNSSSISSLHVTASSAGDVVWAASFYGGLARWTQNTGWVEETFTTSRVNGMDQTADGSLLVGADRGVFRSKPDGGWQELNSGLLGQSVTRLAADSWNGVLYASASFYVYRTPDFGRSWQTLQPPGSYEIGCGTSIRGLEVTRTAERSYLFVGTYRPGDPRGCFPAGGLLRWDPEALWSAGGPPGLFVSLAVDPREGAAAYLTLTPCGYPIPCPGSDVYASSDGGLSWSTRLNPTEFSGLVTLAVDPLSPSTVYGANGGLLTKSDDGGVSWRYAGLRPTISTVFVSGTPSSVYAVISDGVFETLHRSRDSASTWEQMPSIPPSGIRVLAETRDGSILLAGTSSAGVYKSEDFGETWQPMNAGIETMTIYDLEIAPDGRVLYAATGEGVFTFESRSPRVIPAR
jgi:ligand-binding sensor domain-containing protein